jgi:hypothetical protein
MTTTLPSSDLADLVALDVRRNLDDDRAAWLRCDENLDLWYGELIGLARRVDSQLSRNRTEHLARLAEVLTRQAEAAEQRRKIVGFKRLIEDRIAECKALRRLPDTEAARLRTAIENHYQAVTAADGETDTSAADEELWGILKDS